MFSSVNKQLPRNMLWGFIVLVIVVVNIRYMYGYVRLAVNDHEALSAADDVATNQSTSFDSSHKLMTSIELRESLKHLY